VDLRALYRLERVETVAHTWRPVARKPAPPTRTTFSSPQEYVHIREALAAEGADGQWIDWLTDDRDDAEVH
jgi:hypothetical protein